MFTIEFSEYLYLNCDWVLKEVTKNSCNKIRVLYNIHKGDICYGEKGQTI